MLTYNPFMPGGSPSYKKPPLVEVVNGIVFQPLAGLRIAHWGRLWEEFKAEFPKCEHAPPLALDGLASVNPDDIASGFPFVPRLWFINGTEDRLLQFQANRFYYNWRQKPQREIYPRFPEIYKGFEQLWKTFQGFSEREGLGKVLPKECELSYINHIPKEHGWSSPSDIKNILPDIAWNPDLPKD